jgi:predicted membrane protein
MYSMIYSIQCSTCNAVCTEYSAKELSFVIDILIAGIVTFNFSRRFFLACLDRFRPN